MNVYSKLQKAKVNLMTMNIKKTGRNLHRDFNYYELSDFLPIVVGEFDKLGLCSWVSFDNDNATLTIVDSESETDSKIIITSPMAEGNIPGCTPMQNLGGVETYQRRYLYMTALDIVEQDTLDPNVGEKVSKKAERSTMILDDYATAPICEDCGLEILKTKQSSVDKLISKSQKWYGKNLCGPCSGIRYKEKYPDA